jgi:AcrR family transcriptional regulator
MSDSVKHSRPYRSAVRAEQAERTRRRIVDAAAHHFFEHGYAGTALSAVAEKAAVSQETIYATFGSKRGLLEGVIDATLMGPEMPVPLEEQSAWAEIERLPTAHERLRAYVRFSCSVLARTSPVHRIIRGASDGEPFAVELRARLLSERLASNTRRLGQYIGDELRTGLTLDQAAERYCALSSPEIYHLLTVELGWSQSAHEDWLAELAAREILGHSG